MERLVIIFCVVGAIFLFILSFHSETSEERKRNLHPKGK